jgi:hypothetical protein
MTDSAAVEGKVHNKLESGRTMKGPRSAADGDGTEDRDFDALVGHAGERSGAAPRGGGQYVGAEGFEPSLGTV